MRGILPESTYDVCILCDLEEASVDHLMCRCQFFRCVRDRFLNRIDSMWVFNRNVESLIIGGGVRLVGKNEVAWRLIPTIIF